MRPLCWGRRQASPPLVRRRGVGAVGSAVTRHSHCNLHYFNLHIDMAQDSGGARQLGVEAAGGQLHTNTT